eukprot:4067878-Pyramimonas_sp.AAC.1
MDGPDLLAELHAFLKSSGRMARSLLEDDRAALLESTPGHIQDAAESGDARGQWALLRRLLAFGGRPGKYSSKHLPLRMDPSGEVLATPREVADHAHQFFAKIGRAETLTADSTMQKYSCTQPSLVAPPPDRCLDNMMSLGQTARSFKRARWGKNDLVSDSPLRAAP